MSGISPDCTPPSASEAKFPPGSLADAIEDAQRMLADTPQKYGGHKPSAKSDQGGELDDLIRHLNEIRLRMIDRGEYVTNEWADVADATTIGIAIDRLRARSSVSAGGEALHMLPPTPDAVKIADALSQADNALAVLFTMLQKAAPQGAMVADEIRGSVKEAHKLFAQMMVAALSRSSGVGTVGETKTEDGE